MAPELFSPGVKKSRFSDIYAFGMTVLEVSFFCFFLFFAFLIEVVGIDVYWTSAVSGIP
jgi:hypothetical protein